MDKSNSYHLFFQFIETYLPGGFRQIDRDSSLMMNLENMTEADNQFFFVADILQLKILFTSKRSFNMLGVEPENVDPSIFFTATHPDELHRHNLARTRLFSLGQELFIRHKGISILSTNFRTKHFADHYKNILVQCYLFFTTVPYDTVFLFQVVTDISWFNIKYGYHFYLGDDLSFFRYPDRTLLLTGNTFSEKEFDILKMIASGLNSEQIGKKIFRSVHTVNTHRRNILKKSGKSSTTELIYDLKAQGIL